MRSKVGGLSATQRQPRQRQGTFLCCKTSSSRTPGHSIPRCQAPMPHLLGLGEGVVGLHGNGQHVLVAVDEGVGHLGQRGAGRAGREVHVSMAGLGCEGWGRATSCAGHAGKRVTKRATPGDARQAGWEMRRCPTNRAQARRCISAAQHQQAKQRAAAHRGDGGVVELQAGGGHVAQARGDQVAQVVVGDVQHLAGRGGGKEWGQ